MNTPTDNILRFSMQPKEKADYAQIFEEDVASFFPELDMTWDPTQGCYRNQTMRNCELAWLAARNRFDRLTLRGFGGFHAGVPIKSQHQDAPGNEASVLMIDTLAWPKLQTLTEDARPIPPPSTKRFESGAIFREDIWEVPPLFSQRKAPKPTWWQRVKVWFPWN